MSEVTITLSEAELAAVLGALDVAAEYDAPADLARSTIEAQTRKAERGTCKRCGSELTAEGYCVDLTCPHSDYLQHETWTEG